MRIEANNAIYDMELKNQDFETQVERHDDISKLEEGVDKSRSVNENVDRWLEFKFANRRYLSSL